MQQRVLIPSQVSNDIKAALDSHPSLKAYLTSVITTLVWEPDIPHDQMLIREGARRLAIDILTAAQLEKVAADEVIDSIPKDEPSE